MVILSHSSGANYVINFPGMMQLISGSMNTVSSSFCHHLQTPLQPSNRTAVTAVMSSDIVAMKCELWGFIVALLLRRRFASNTSAMCCPLTVVEASLGAAMDSLSIDIKSALQYNNINVDDTEESTATTTEKEIEHTKEVQSASDCDPSSYGSSEHHKHDSSSDSINSSDNNNRSKGSSYHRRLPILTSLCRSLTVLTSEGCGSAMLLREYYSAGAAIDREQLHSKLSDITRDLIQIVSDNLRTSYVLFETEGISSTSSVEITTESNNNLCDTPRDKNIIGSGSSSIKQQLENAKRLLKTLQGFLQGSTSNKAD